MKYRWMTLKVLMVVIGVWCSTEAVAEEKVLTEADVVEGVRNRSDVKQAVSSRVEAASAEVKEASLFDNPEISFEREQLYSNNNEETESVAAISKSFDISGARRRRIEAAEHGVRAAELEGEVFQFELVQDVRVIFFRALHAQKQKEALLVWTERLAKSVEEVRSRSKAGDASGYDLLRLSRELSLARADLVQAEAGLMRLLSNLEAMLGLSEDGEAVRLVGELVPEDGPASTEALLAAIERHPTLQAMEAETQAAELQAEAARRGWVPPISLTAGYKTAANQDERAHGFIVGVSAPLPIFSRGQGEKRMSEATARLGEVERTLLLTQRNGRGKGLAREGEKLIAGAVNLRKEMEETSETLIRTAELSYRGGELSVVELIDAYNNHIGAELGALSLELLAREAVIELERIIGESK